MRLVVALQAFFGALFSRDACQRIQAALRSPTKTLPQPEAPLNPNATSPETKAQGKATATSTQGAQVASSKVSSSRSEALTMLSVLQREARLLDLVQESLDEYSDAQVGAAARDVLRDSRNVLQRLFAVEPLAKEGEGARIAIPNSASPLRYRLVGNASDKLTSGTVVHAGWQATKCQLPQWNGPSEDALILAPIEMEAS